MSIHWLWPSAAVLSFALTWLAMRVAWKRRLLDFPNERSSHDRPIPRGGGVAVVLTFMLGLLAAASLGLVERPLLAAILGGGGLVALIGLVDDYRSVSAAWRLTLHVPAAILALYWLGGLPAGLLPGIPALPINILGVVCAVWLINLYNFMDGIDGIAGIETTTVCFGQLVCIACAGASGVAGGAVWLAPGLLLASTAGFLFWNFPSARTFLGDAGSGFLGFMMAVFCIVAARLEPALFWAWIILLGVFIVDSGVTLARRMLRRRPLHEPHRSHAYQFASRHCGGHAPVSLAVGGINLFWLLPMALLVSAGGLPAALILPIAYAPLIWLAFHFRAGALELQEEPAGSDA